MSRRGATALLVGRRMSSSALGRRGRETTIRLGEARACSSAYVMMTINAVASVVVILTETATATVENDIIETATANEAGIVIVIVMMMDLGLGYTSGGQPAKAKIPRATMMTEAGGRSGGAKIVGGKMAEAGTASRNVTGMAIGNEQGRTNESVGQVGMIGTHEVLNTEEGIHDDILSNGVSRARVHLIVHHRLYSSGPSSRPRLT